MRQVKLQADIRRMLPLLGQSMYAGDVVAIAAKELLQNSYDAVKTQLRQHRIEVGSIKFSVNSKDNSLTIKDNGCGMSPETVEKAFLQICGTLKDLDTGDRSGGLGVAKVQFFATTCRIKLSTVKGGIRTSFDTDTISLLEGSVKVVDDELTDAPNGTEITFFYPKDKVTVPFWVPDTIKHPLVDHNDDIIVTWKGDRVCKMDSKYTDHMDFNFSWADIRVYVNIKDPLTKNGDQRIFSAGLYQFKYDFYKEFLGYLKMDVLINIRPKVTAEDDLYPFNLQRQGFKPQDQILEDLKTIGSYLFDIQFMIRQEQILAEFAAMESLDYLALDATAAPQQRLDRRCPVAYSEEFVSKMTRLFSQVNGSIYKEPDVVKETRIAAKQYEIDAQNSTLLKYQNKTNGDFSEYRLLFSKIASATLDAVRMLPEQMKNSEKFPVVTGVVISKKEQGFLMTGTNKALCINPCCCKDATSQETWVLYMMYVFIHEATHIVRSYHDDEFCSLMGSLWQGLQMEGAYDRIAGLYRTIWVQHGPEIVRASDELKHASQR